MALQGPFFGKKDAEPFSPRPTPTSGGATPMNSPSPAPLSSPVSASVSTVASSASAPTGSEGSKLTVGPNIKLRGVEITDCDTLVVEGTVEATMNSRVIQIAETGAFKGAAEIDIAEIRGNFDGELTVREKLVVFATGKVTGKVRYGKIVIEEGGQISGEVTFGTGGAKPVSSSPAPAPAPATATASAS